MDCWFEKGRPALFKALNKVCQQIDHDLTNELASRKSALAAQDEKTACSTPSTELVQQLQREIEQLKQSTHAPTDKGQHHAPEISEPPPSGIQDQSQLPTTSGDPVQGPPSDTVTKDWKAEYAKLSLRYNALSQNFKKAKEALERRKKERDDWISHADALTLRVQQAEKKHGISILHRSGPNHVDADQAQLPPPPPPLPTSLEPHATRQLPTMHAPYIPAEPRHHPSDTTEGETEDSRNALPLLPPNESTNANVTIKHEPSSDTPQVVSERVIKKRKPDEDLSAEAARRPKLEPSDGSSPVVSTSRFHSSQQSLDLGDLPQHMLTPRKRKDLDLSRPAGGASTRTAAVVFSDATLPNSAPRMARMDHTTSALTPISVNRRLVQTVGNKPKDKKRRRQEDLRQGIAVLAEDSHGDQEPDGARLESLRHGKLAKMLEHGYTEVDSPLVRMAHRREKPSMDGHLPIPHKRALPFESGGLAATGTEEPRSKTPIAREAKSTSNSVTARQSTDHRSSAKSLRSQPVSKLQLSDFKVNPNVNDGQDFAFTEVVRNRDDRTCLPGCTDMHCCGREFRALAESMRPNSPLTPAQKLEQQALLEGYLGEQCHKLSSMSPGEKDQMWLEAKTQELANKYGKHRHRFSRMRSPPGFWDADFPSTQELEAEKAEAAKRERSSVQQRYREALKPGGRWIFRDE